MHDEELKTRLRSSLDRGPTARGGLDRVSRRARRLRLRRYAAMTISALILGAGVAVPLWSLSSVHGNHAVVGGSVQDFGIHIDVPPGWDEQLSYRATDLGPV